MNVAYNMDCLEAMRSMPDKHFNLAVVDPPYGLKISHNMGRRKGEKPSDYKKVTWDAEPPPPEYFRELVRVSQNQIIFGANHFITRIPEADTHCWICWDKGFSEDVSFASFELAWTSFDRPCKRLALASNQAGRIHPTQKPVALYAWIFSKFTQPGDKILDTHLGSGSSRIAAWDAGLDFTGYEIDADYFMAQEQRFEAHTAQISIFGGGGVTLITFLFLAMAQEPSIIKEERTMKVRHTIENEITWAQLKAAAQSGTAEALVQPFNEIDLTTEDGEQVTVVVAAHLPATEDKPAGIRFVFKDCLDEPHNMNDDWTNKGGYKVSGGRQHVLEKVLPRLPADLRAVIRPRKIVEIAQGQVLEYEDPLWLPSETDMFGRGDGSWQNGKADGPEDFQLPIFLTERDRVKMRRGYGTTPYWLRSAYYGTSYIFCLVYTGGSAADSTANYSYGVAPGFDI